VKALLTHDFKVINLGMLSGCSSIIFSISRAMDHTVV
jgi:hypothetical protein